MKLIVTRPEPEASHTAQRVKLLGHEPILCPLLQLVPKPVQLPAGPLAGLVATSPNAIRFLSNQTVERLCSVPLYHTGEKTGEVAASRGFALLCSLGDTVDELIEGFRKMEPEGGQYLYLAGEARTRELQKDLCREGIIITLIETYKAEAATGIPANIRLALREGAATMLYSRRTAEIFLQLARQDLSAAPSFFVLSQKIASVIENALPHAKISIADKPNEDALLDILPAQ